MKDKDFYGSGSHPEAGSPMVKINGQWYSQVNLDYIGSQSGSLDPRSLERGFAKAEETSNQIKSDTVNHTGFSKGKKTTDILPEDHDPVEAKRQRLVLLQQQEARLAKQLDRLRKVIKIVKESI